jgi:hypothetical protein
VEQYFGLSHLHDGAKRARFTNIAKSKFDGWYRQAAYNISRGLKILANATGPRHHRAKNSGPIFIPD